MATINYRAAAYPTPPVRIHLGNNVFAVIKCLDPAVAVISFVKTALGTLELVEIDKPEDVSVVCMDDNETLRCMDGKHIPIAWMVDYKIMMGDQQVAYLKHKRGHDIYLGHD